MRSSLVFVALIILAGACAEPPKVDTPRSQVSQRERDSTVAESGLPGAGVVKKGMSIADKEAKRSAMIDSLTEN